jgi:ribosome maturation factor RimP
VALSSRQKVLTELVSPIVEALGCELWGIECLSQGRFTLVRIYIDKDGGVGLEDCEKVSRQVSSLMDVEDPITGQYTLEVSSPGIERPLYILSHFERYVGEKVQIKLNRRFEDRKKITGLLAGVENDEVIIQVGEDEFVLPIEWIDKANVIPAF